MSEEASNLSQPETQAPETQGAPDTQTPETQAAPEPKKPEEAKKYRVVVNGKEMFLTGDQLTRDYQLASASREKMEHAAKSRKQVEALLRRFKEDPAGTFAELAAHPEIGHDPHKVASQILMRQLERGAMTPEQRELADARERLAKYEAEAKERETAAEQHRRQALLQEATQQLETEAVEAIRGCDELPQNAHTFRRVMQYVQAAHTRGRYDVGPKDVVRWVVEDYQNEAKHYIGRFDAEKLAALLGEDAIKKLRARDVKQFRETPVQNSAPEPTRDARPPKTDATKRQLTFAETAELIRRGKL